MEGKGNKTPQSKEDVRKAWLVRQYEDMKEAQTKMQEDIARRASA